MLFELRSLHWQELVEGVAAEAKAGGGRERSPRRVQLPDSHELGSEALLGSQGLRSSGPMGSRGKYQLSWLGPCTANCCGRRPWPACQGSGREGPQRARWADACIHPFCHSVSPFTRRALSEPLRSARHCVQPRNSAL